MVSLAKVLLRAGFCLLLAGSTTFCRAQIQPKQANPPPASVPASSSQSNYSKQAYIVEKYDRVYDFHADGTWEETTTAKIRVQSQAGVQIFGDLSLSYESDNQRTKIAYVRVLAPDGSVTDTPASNVQDVPAAVTLQAPVYSDLRVKEIPVTNLNPGDTLEYQFQTDEFRPEVPNQFWLALDFLTDNIVLDEDVEIRVPKDKYVKVASATVKPTIQEQGNEKVYEWKTSRLHEDKDTAKKQKKSKDEKPSIQITTFKSWQQVGEWYRGLAVSRAAVTPAIQKKEQEITSGLTTDAAKQQAIYSYVSTQIRYIALSFGIGRLQPHFAETVLRNKYGDCKDKHTLFAALMKAAGYQVWPALIGAGIKLDSDVPSPGQFNHLISVLPQGKQLTWLDTTEEVAPFGMLARSLRDKQALVMPATGEPELMKTPVNPPFPTALLFTMKAALDDKDVLTGHVNLKMRGDLEMAYRAAFRAVPQENWTKLMQLLSYHLGFGGTVSNVTASDPDKTEKPFHVQYDYLRKDYGGYDGKWIAPPFPPVPFVLGEDSDQPDDTIPLGAPGVRDYRATVTLPKGEVATLAPDKTLKTDFAEYRKTSSVKDGVLTAERFYNVTVPKLPAAQWDDYLKFVKAVDAREKLMISLAPSNTNSVKKNRDSREANQLLIQADGDIRARNFAAAEALLRRAKTLNPTQFGMGEVYGDLYEGKGEVDRAIASYRQEMARHPDNKQAGNRLARLLVKQHHLEEAAKVLEGLLQQYPNDATTIQHLASVRFFQKRYGDAAALLKPIADKPGSSPQVKMMLVLAELKAGLGEAEMKVGQKEAAVTVLEEAMREAKEPMTINNAAYELAQNGADLAEAQQYVQKALQQVETATAKTSLANLTSKDLAQVLELGAIWDTAGWLEFKQGHDAEAEKYVDAAWMLGQRGDVADHLGQILKKEGKNRQAAHMDRLALAAGGLTDSSATAQRLEKLQKGPYKAMSQRTFADKEELSRLRTVHIHIAHQPKKSIFAQFFVLLTPDGVEDVEFVSGDKSLRSAASLIKNAKYRLSFPDSGPEKIARKGILSCSPYAPTCEFVWMLPRDVLAENIASGQVAHASGSKATQ